MASSNISIHRYDFAHAMGTVRLLLSRGYLSEAELHEKLMSEGLDSGTAHLLLRAARFMLDLEA